MKKGAPKKFDELMHRYGLRLPESAMEKVRRIAKESKPRKSIATILQEIILEGLKIR